MSDGREDAAAFALRYRGSWAPEDALTWLRDPNADGPSGAPSPYREVGRLRRAVYARDAAPETAQRYAAAERALAAEIELVRAALRPDPAEDEPVAPDAPDAADAPEGDAARPDPAESPGPRPRSRIVPIVVAAVFAAGIALIVPTLLSRHSPAPTATRTAAVGQPTFTLNPLPSSAARPYPTSCAGCAGTRGATQPVPGSDPDTGVIGGEVLLNTSGRGTRTFPLPHMAEARHTVVYFVCNAHGTFSWALTGQVLNRFGTPHKTVVDAGGGLDCTPGNLSSDTVDGDYQPDALRVVIAPTIRYAVLVVTYGS